VVYSEHFLFVSSQRTGSVACELNFLDPNSLANESGQQTTPFLRTVFVKQQNAYDNG
jgi:hypothetical protein